MSELKIEFEEPESPRPAAARISSYFTRLLDHLQPSSQIVLVMTALVVGIAIRIYDKYGTFDITRIKKLKG